MHPGLQPIAELASARLGGQGDAADLSVRGGLRADQAGLPVLLIGAGADGQQ